MTMTMTQSEYPNIIGKVFFIEPFDEIPDCTLIAGKQYLAVFFDETTNRVFFYEAKKDSWGDFAFDKNKIYQSPYFSQLQQTENIVDEFQVNMTFSIKKKERLPKLNIEDILKSMIGKVNTKEESDSLTSYINYYFKQYGIKEVTTKELIALYRQNPLDFRRLDYISNNKHEAEELRNEISELNVDEVTESVFDFVVDKVQIANAEKLVSEYHSGLMKIKHITEILSSSVMLYFESKDYSISDTLPRGLFFDMAEDAGYIEY